MASKEFQLGESALKVFDVALSMVQPEIQYVAVIADGAGMRSEGVIQTKMAASKPMNLGDRLLAHLLLNIARTNNMTPAQYSEMIAKALLLAEKHGAPELDPKLVSIGQVKTEDDVADGIVRELRLPEIPGADLEDA